MALQDLVRILVPRESQFYDCLEKQADAACEGARAIAAFKDGNAEAVNKAVQEVEHQGDKLHHDLEDALAQTFVTPIDREDIQKLSAELDDILDLTNGAARACVLYGVERPTEPMVKLIDILVRATEALKDGLPHLRKHQYSQITEASRTVRRLEKEGDAVFREAVSKLFHDPAVDAKVLLKQKEVLEDLENAIDHSARAAATLALLAIKHG